MGMKAEITTGDLSEWFALCKVMQRSLFPPIVTFVWHTEFVRDYFLITSSFCVIQPDLSHTGR